MKAVTSALAAFLIAAVPAAAEATNAYRLHGSDGSTITERSFRGKVQFIFFGFTHCPDVCPTGLSNLARALSLLGPQRRDVRILFVSVDPARDTMTLLRRYVGHFAPEVVGVTGRPEQIDRMTKRFAAGYSIARGPGRYEVSHSGTVFILDREGRLARRLSSGARPEAFADTARTLLSAKSR